VSGHPRAARLKHLLRKMRSAGGMSLPEQIMTGFWHKFLLPWVLSFFFIAGPLVFRFITVIRVKGLKSKPVSQVRA